MNFTVDKRIIKRAVRMNNDDDYTILPNLVPRLYLFSSLVHLVHKLGNTVQAPFCSCRSLQFRCNGRCGDSLSAALHYTCTAHIHQRCSDLLGTPPCHHHHRMFDLRHYKPKTELSLGVGLLELKKYVARVSLCSSKCIAEANMKVIVMRSR